MASPPLQVEDQTDEDFFDKLVDDDYRVGEYGKGLVDGDDSDELKAFSNLSIGEVGGNLEDSGGGSVVPAAGQKNSGDEAGSSSDAALEKNELAAGETVSLVSSDSLALNGVIESVDGTTGADIASDSTTSKSSGSASAGVKEVQWSSFSTDSAQRDSGGFGSFSDLFNVLGDNSIDPFANMDDIPEAKSNLTSSIVENTTADVSGAFSSLEHQEGQAYGVSVERTAGVDDTNSIQYWESLYPGWRYDSNTGEWHQSGGYDAMANAQGSPDVTALSESDGFVSEERTEVSYLQQSAQSVMGTFAENCTTPMISKWNQVSQGNTEYPPHMLFDPQYPGWYYDTIAQEWRMLGYCTPDFQLSTTATGQQNQNGYTLADSFIHEKENTQYDHYNKFQNFGSQNLGSQNQHQDWSGSLYNYDQQDMHIWKPDTVGESGAISGFTENQQFGNLYGSSGSVNHCEDRLTGSTSTGTVSSYDLTSRNYSSNGVAEFQSFVAPEKFSPQINQPKMDQSQQMNFSHDYYGGHESATLSQPQFQSGSQFSYGMNEERSSAGRPPHALVTFGFGGKLIVMKDNSSFLTNSAYGSQGSSGSSISILNLIDVVMDKNDASSGGVDACDYFRALCHQNFPGPLVGGSSGSKELNKWIDERITNCESPNMDYRKGILLRLLLSLLKIACQHYGKLRSPFGTDPALRENDCPELAVAKLFASIKRNGAQLGEYGALTHCLWNLPSEGQIRATAVEVQNLLVAGRKKEALQCAQEGQLWGPALILASELGNQFYAETVKQMALCQLVAGSPLRTLCLLIAGQPADVFSVDTTINNHLSGAMIMSQQPAQIGSNSMLDDWEENLAIITANRTKDDELVIIHLGDCLWKERCEIIAAHICYLVAEANFESYSDTARMCLIGADHWRFPRTFASPEAIQRTELYEHSKVLGNSQYTLLPFQPYKLIYAYMLAEVGKVADALKYCQAILKSLKTGRAPEVDIWKQMVSSLEERIRTHQQSGNLAPAKLVGKLLTFFDNTVRSVGGPPPPAPTMSQSIVQSNELDQRQVGPRVTNSQSTMAMSSLVPSASMEPISGFSGDNSRVARHNRSISEPDFGRSPKQGEAASSEGQGKASISGVPSRFGRIGSQLFQKTMGLVMRSRPDRQAKLGEKNKFYYDEKLKRWVEEGSEPPAEEAALPPPPRTMAFQNGMSNYSIKNAFKSEGVSANDEPEIKSPNPSERSSGIPPIPPGSNQFSSRGRMGVRSRYVDTFNKGGGTPANIFQSPSIPAVKPGTGANAKFFIPTPAATSEQIADASYGEGMQEATASNEVPSASVTKDSYLSPPLSSPTTMQRFPSMDNITKKGMGVMASRGDSFSQSRRTASWSGSFSDTFNHKTTETKPSGEALVMPSSSFTPSEPASINLPMSGGNFGDDLHEVEL